MRKSLQLSELVSVAVVKVYLKRKRTLLARVETPAIGVSHFVAQSWVTLRTCFLQGSRALYELLCFCLLRASLASAGPLGRFAEPVF